MNLLLQQQSGGTLLRVPDFLGYTALLVACRNGHLKVVKLLLEHPEGGDALLEDKDHGTHVHVCMCTCMCMCVSIACRKQIWESGEKAAGRG